jgi:Family of unknown function (DUF6049)
VARLAGTVFVAAAPSVAAFTVATAAAAAFQGNVNPPIPSAAVASGVSVGPPGVALLQQSPWVESGHDFRLRLQLTAPTPTDDRLVVTAFGRLTTRTDFDNAAKGEANTFAWYTAGPLRLSKLPRDPAGGVDVDIPVNAPSGSGTGIPTFQAAAGSGVFPLQIGLVDSTGAPKGQPISTFLVYAAGPPSVTNLPRLSVALVVPVHAPPSISSSGTVGPVDGADSARLAAIAGALAAHPDVALTVEATPQTLDALAVGGARDKGTAAELASLVRPGGDQIVPAPYVRISVDDMQNSGLGAELGRQFSAGASQLAGVFGTVPTRTTWVADGTLDKQSLGFLVSSGADHVIVPDSDLSPLPASAIETTFAMPSHLTGASDPKLQVYGADSGLTQYFLDGEPPVLAANQLLAEMSMIQLETPGITRGVVVLPPQGWVADPSFVATLTAGLEGHPLLSAVTASQLFAAVPAAPVDRQLQPPGSFQALSSPTTSVPSTSTSFGSSTTAPSPAVTSPPTAVTLGPDAAAIRSARSEVGALASVLPTETSVSGPLTKALLVAESTDLTEAQRLSVLATLRKSSGRILGQVSLPSASSITLTATRGQVPLTILSSPSLHAHVQLQLRSQRLIFQHFVPPDGRCQVVTPTGETCELTLTGGNVTLKVPVEARSSGVFPLEVSLYSPDGAQLLAKDLDTVRSTAVSGVGIVLIVLAVVSLAIWWIRDLRHGRRARRLVPAPAEEDEDDPVVSAFFSTPPPEYDKPPTGPK